VKPEIHCIQWNAAYSDWRPVVIDVASVILSDCWWRYSVAMSMWNDSDGQYRPVTVVLWYLLLMSIGNSCEVTGDVGDTTTMMTIGKWYEYFPVTLVLLLVMMIWYLIER
jgi:hypothetical protein